VGAAGWRVGTVGAAYGAWTAAAAGAVAAAPKGPALRAVVAVEAGTAHVLQLAGGAVSALRRLPAGALDEVVAAAGAEVGTVAEAGTVAVFADATSRDALADRFRAAGWTVAAPPWSAAEAAARYAHAAGPRLVAAAAVAEQRRLERHGAVALAAAAVVLVIGAGIVELWGARRELDAVRGRRAEIRAAVQPLLALRDSMDAYAADAAGIDALAAAAPRWTGALFDVAMVLPSETHLTRLYATGDTLIVDAAGARAGAALQALRAAGTLRDVRLIGVIDRELADGATAVERFRLSARLAEPAGASTGPAGTSTGTASAGLTVGRQP
jgi:hypothetical protein